MTTIVAFLCIASILIYINLNFLSRNKDFDWTYQHGWLNNGSRGRFRLTGWRVVSPNYQQWDVRCRYAQSTCVEQITKHHDGSTPSPVTKNKNYGSNIYCKWHFYFVCFIYSLVYNLFYNL
jgi:hypothetical protein